MVSVVAALPQQQQPTVVKNVSRFEDDESMEIILTAYNEEASRRCNRLSKANWGVDTNDGDDAMKAEQVLEKKKKFPKILFISQVVI